MNLIYIANVSLDGYIEDSNGNFNWTAPSDEVFAFITDLVRPVGSYLYGRRMYETMAVCALDPTLAPTPGSGPTSPRSGRRPTRSSTPRPCLRPRREARTVSAGSTPMRSGR